MTAAIHLSALVFLALLPCQLCADVRLERVPEDGMQPQVAVSADDTVHLVYLKGAPQGCDVRYTSKNSKSAEWSAPVTVNTTPKSAMAMGTIRGAQISLGKENSVHVVWNGVAPKDASGRYGSAPLFYTRMEASKKVFEPQRDLISGTQHLDGGASIAANAGGTVFIVWHAARPEKQGDETQRVVFVLKSPDNGATFTPLKIANAEDSGVCACCSLKAFVTPGGGLIALYRSARSVAQRDITQLSSRDGGLTFTHQTLHPWATGACPMSSMTMLSSGQRTRAAWETDEMVFSSLLGADFAPQNISGGKARHPALAINRRGETLVSWSTGTGWQRGGGLAWCILDAAGKPTTQRGEASGVPVWSFTAAYADAHDDFVILY